MVMDQPQRRRARATTIVVAALVAFLGAGLFPLSPSLSARAAAAPLTVASSPSAAAKAHAEARALRRDVAALLQKYLDDYGSRFTDAERQQLLGYRDDADNHLARVVLTTGILERAIASNAPARTRKAAAVNAQTAYRRAKTQADSALASARQIMEPKLSMLERLSALTDYNTMLDRFDALGARIDAAAKAA